MNIIVLQLREAANISLLSWVGCIDAVKIKLTPTEKECYCKKSKLSKVGTTVKFIVAKEMGSKERDTRKKNVFFLLKNDEEDKRNFEEN
jgi:metal-sulfur cluster biosynthetic enzyme